MQAYNLLIATPDATLYEGEVKSAIFFGEDGFFEVLADHAPIIAMVQEGEVTITDASGQKHKIKTGDGFFEFHKTKGVLLVSQSQAEQI